MGPVRMYMAGLANSARAVLYQTVRYGWVMNDGIESVIMQMFEQRPED